MKAAMSKLVVLALVIAAACGEGAGADPKNEITHPTGAKDLILRVETGGGFVPPEFALGNIPEFSLMGDGTVITLGPQIMIYPGPALKNLLKRKVSPDGVDAILKAAMDAGLFGNHSYGFEGVADAPTTTFRLVANGKLHVTSAYALGMDDQGRSLVSPDRQARQKLAEFRDKLSGLEQWLPKGSVSAESGYVPQGMRIFVTDQPSAATDDPVGQQTPIVWPLDVPLSEFGEAASLEAYRCGTITGADLGKFLAAATHASELSPWSSGGKNYRLVLRPLMPDESGCPR
jgi:hypothetical protein